MKALILVLIFVVPISIFSQNLIPNGDFNNPIKDSALTEHCLFVPEWSYVEYFIIGNNNEILKQKNIDFKKNDNNRFAGAHPHTSIIHVSLLEPLEKGKTYCFSLDITTFGEKPKTNLVEVYFKKSIDIKNRNVYAHISNKAVFLKLNKTTNHNPDNHWETLCANYKANGGEKYIFFTFLNYKNIETIYFDNVKLTKNDYKKNICCLCNNTINKMDTLVLENLHFNTNSSIIELNSYPELNKLVDFLKANASLKLVISGHTDNTGNPDKNKALSEQRAKAVYDYLVKNGISQDRLKFVGHGDTKPLLPNTSEQNKTKNRRVEIVFE